MADTRLSIASWNVAAVNNNPFEQRITWDDDPRYNELMGKVESFIEEPGSQDIKVKEVLTDAMVERLFQVMSKEEGWSGVDAVRHIWSTDFSERRVVSTFLKDKSLGKKRLISMPDRLTNTIRCVDKSRLCRPTIINAYAADLPNINVWFDAWMEFMFATEAEVFTSAGTSRSRICSMLKPIKRSKYPDVTEEEEAISIPLQTLALAIFDAVMVHMVNTLAESYWYEIKMTLFTAIYENKLRRIIEILSKTYSSCDVICVQEASAAFLQQAAESDLYKTYHVVAPGRLDGVRNQNSLILLNRTRFDKWEETTDAVLTRYNALTTLRLEDGDLFSLACRGTDGKSYFLASFHGDTNGLASTPVIEALMQCHSEEFSDHIPIFGIDANTHADKKPKTKDVLEFFTDIEKLKLESCQGKVGSVNPTEIYTTFSARTFLQPQFQKATRAADVQELADHNPKDHIVFRPTDFSVETVSRDNTGEGKFAELTVFPTIEFPSDHAVLHSTLASSSK